MLKRILCDLPEQGCDLGNLRGEAFAAFPNMIDLNEVDFDLDPNSEESGKRIAFYFNDGDAPDSGDLDALLDAHDPTLAPVAAPRDWAAELETAATWEDARAILVAKERGE